MRFLLSVFCLLCLPALGFIQPPAFAQEVPQALPQALPQAPPQTPPPATVQMGDAVAGAKVFRKCRACHMVGKGAKNRVGPHLNNIVEGKVAQVAGFNYSKGLRAYAESQAIWTPAALDAYLAQPSALVKGGRMAFAGLKKAKERLDVIAYLKQFSAQ